MSGLDYRSVALQSASMCFDIVSGFHEPAEAVGEDDVVPEATGRSEGLWRDDQRRIILEGYVMGVGATWVERQQSWHEQTATLMALMDRSASPGTLEVTAPYMGLETGFSASLTARCKNLIPGPIKNRMSFQEWSIELVCIDSPPDWEFES